MKNRYKNLKPLFTAMLIGAAALAVSLVVACTNPAGGGGGDAKYPVVGLDPKLAGTWRAEFPSAWEQYDITSGTLTYGGSYAGSYGTGPYGEYFAGNIVYAEQFSDKAGVIIIEYLPGREGTWYSLSNQSHPDGYTFYGIYYHQMNGNGSAGTTVYFSNTSDQDPSGPYGQYGPSETETLAQAKARFTEGNMNNWMDRSVGDPQTKQ
jgi:hypothetical protein